MVNVSQQFVLGLILPPCVSPRLKNMYFVCMRVHVHASVHENQNIMVLDFGSAGLHVTLCATRGEQKEWFVYINLTFFSLFFFLLALAACLGHMELINIQWAADLHTRS